MFYNHEVLTNRKYGVATIWLVATLGSKSSLKRVNRKAILDVNVTKACETIIMPEAPMALRLQSSLLYGVSRVYSQQCGYVLADAQSAQNNLLQLLRVTRTSELDPEAGRTTRPDQLLLQDDPAFMPGLAFGGFDLDLSNLDITTSAQSSSILSPRSGLSNRSSHGSALGIIIPSSISGGGAGIGAFQLPGDDEFHDGRLSGLGQNIPGMGDADNDFLPDADFEFDAEGNLVEFNLPGSAARAPAPPIAGLRAGNDTAAIEQVRREHEEAQQADFNFNVDDEMELDIPRGDNYPTYPEAQPFPERTRPHAQQSSVLCSSSIDRPRQEGEGSDYAADAPMTRKTRVPKALPLDRAMELGNSVIKAWNENYLENMAKATEIKLQHKIPFLAKRNADFWIWGAGIGGIGKELRGLGIPTALDMFYGAGLYETVMGIKPAAVAGSKRQLDTEGETTEEEGRRVRPRGEDSDEIARGDGAAVMDEDGYALGTEIEDPEIGRAAPTPLPGDLANDLSSTMPWNIHSASRRSASLQRGFRVTSRAPSLGAGSGSLAQRRGSRITSASPLFGRGTAQPELGRFSRQASLSFGPAALVQRHGVSSSLNGDVGGGNFGVDFGREDNGGLRNSGDDEFELFGPGANVDTQTAGASQWVRDALDHESDNFLEFVQAAVAERSEQEEHDGGEGGPASNETTFATLLPPSSNTRVVAAQGLLHVLTLATKGLLWVVQEEGFGSIRLGLTAGFMITAH